MRKRWFVLAPLAIAGFVLFIAIGGEVVRQLWNWLMLALFGWPHITFWQAVGLLALCRILFGRTGGRRYQSRFSRRRAERWGGMTAEQRERFRRGMRARCGFDPPVNETNAPTP